MRVVGDGDAKGKRGAGEGERLTARAPSDCIFSPPPYHLDKIRNESKKRVLVPAKHNQPAREVRFSELAS